MVFKLINATEARQGTNIIVDGVPCVIKSVDISKTGKHGHSKVRIEAVGIITEQKKVFVVPGHDRLEIPLVEKKKGQILSISDTENKVSVMDLESFETLDVPCSEDIKEQVKEGDQVEYWDIEGQKIVKRKL